MITWEELSKEYAKEINDLWHDIESALIELEKGMPKSYKNGIRILEKCLDLSIENVKMLSCLSTERLNSIFEKKKTDNISIQPVNNKSTHNEDKQKIIRKDNNDEDCFKWLRNSE